MTAQRLAFGGAHSCFAWNPLMGAPAKPRLVYDCTVPRAGAR